MTALCCRYQELQQHCAENNIAPEMITSFKAADEDADLEFLLEEIPGAIAQSLDGVEKSIQVLRTKLIRHYSMWVIIYVF